VRIAAVAERHAPLTATRWFPLTVGALTIVAVGVIFEVLLRIGVLNRYIIPLPSEVLAAFERIVAEEGVIERTGTSAFEVLSAGFACIAVGVPLGVLLYRFNILRRALEDWVAALAAAPIVLAYPLFMVLFGRGSMTVIVIAFAYGLAPIVLKTVEGLSETRSVLVNVGKSLNLSEAQMFWKILFPSAIPSIFTGIRLGWTFCVIAVIGVEFLVNLGGLGQLINDLAERYDMPGTYASIGFVIGISMIFFIILEWVEKWLQPAR
jgi:ABC-type nitrate/sulfonate/bicarbonate transport system permease component